ncbi:DHH family phosphoesterase [Weissella koreensis]|uniref:Bifunctional oligoribonuclease/PAP phosphatase NrnA n=1 Tax=Weissella koreensis TaxID=165096 RepID=A0A7H1MKA5_9LACO|nr:bifunctional oligoribonuclease/PAP phosphatase NrnA [Weissella koreensis]AVH74633.1 bifunctional oligoribonuclease/PAP phosphatase NrnA [Weissella koreensis]EJF33985.1 phosphoesterase [Weissella koreensis KCTC 3621]EJF34275.1 phosphoesterase [Weissella koreensis KCTC 3621]QGN19856.1 bifunctional oligoribonuclease/PAP phosphatase NrnA [Weissella koreensis]QNT63891.1 bifunctional oligoribonuclease/PAP phosphatase NrnA [Weissella koreensis]
MTAETVILEQIKKHDTIIIHRHQRPDPDAFGAQFGLADLIQNSFPEKKVYTVGKMQHSALWMGTMDEIEDQLYEDALVIVVDTANTPRVDDQRWEQGATIVKIDHHPNEEPYGDYNWVIEGASSTSAIIFSFYQQFKNELALSNSGASYLYNGIVGDTGRFLYATNAKTMEVVAGLMEFDFDWFKINQMMDTISPAAAKMSGYVLSNMQMNDLGLNYIILKHDVVESFELGDFGTAFVVPLLGKVNTMKAWIIFEEQEEGFYRVRMRSRDVVINKVAARHGGGGHPFASGALAQDQTEINTIIDEVNAVLETTINE